MKNIIYSTFKEVNRLMPEKSRKKQRWIMFLLFVNSIFEIIGLSSLIPLFSIVVSENIETNYFFMLFEDLYGLTTVKGFIIALGIHIALIIVLKNIASLWIYRAVGRYAYQLSKDFALRALKSKYKLSFLKLFSDNSHNHIWEVNSLPNFYVNFIILQLYQIINELIIVGIILAGMIYMDPVILAILGITLIPTFLLFYRAVKNKIQRFEEEKAELLPLVNATVQQMIFGYTDVKVTGTERSFVGVFDGITDRMKNIYTNLYVYQKAPSKVIESAIIFGVVGIIFYGILFVEDRQAIFDLLMLYAIAAFRLAPSGSRVMLSLMSLKKYQYTLGRLKKVIHHEKSVSNKDLADSDVPSIPFEKEIHLDNVHFTYNDEDGKVLDGVDLVIPKGKSIGIVGKSGSGKSTLMKLVLGFLESQEGHLKVDGVVLNEGNMESWRKLIGYVGQDVFIIEGTIEENIAFGIDKEDYDSELMKKVVAMASLTDFIDSLPEGIQTFIGERGSQISGGQKQRIAIARALYSGASVLFFDEATSALDKDTEKEITESIRNIGEGSEITTVIIAHNHNTLKYCDEIIEMEEGKIRRTGIV